MHMNQGDERRWRSLRTILSTKIVQNIAAGAGSMANSSDCLISPKNSPLPRFCAVQNFPYKSTNFPTVKVLAHILIHKKCAERLKSHSLVQTERKLSSGDNFRAFGGQDPASDAKNWPKRLFDVHFILCRFFSQ